MKLIFDAIAFIASVMTVVAFIAMFLSQERFQYFIIVMIGLLFGIDAMVFSRMNMLANRLNKLEGRLR